MINRSIQLLCDNLKLQIDDMVAMKALVQRQFELTRSDSFPFNMDEYQVIAEKRRNLLDKFSRLQAEAEELQTTISKYLGLNNFQLKAIQDRVDPESYRELAGAYARLGWVLGEVVSLDTEIESLIRTRLNKRNSPPKKDRNAIDRYRSSMQFKPDKDRSPH